MNPEFDERDAAILKTRIEALDTIEGPRTGDFVRFPCGALLRISHRWDDAAQVSEISAGSWYLGEGHVSFSGSLYPGVPLTSLTRTPEVRDGSCWFFHHGYAGAHCGVNARAQFRVYSCNVTSESCSHLHGFGANNCKPPARSRADTAKGANALKLQTVRLSAESSREDLIEWLAHDDPNGCWTDADSIAEHDAPLTIEEAWGAVEGFVTDCTPA